MTKTALAVLLATLPIVASAGEIYGTIKEGGAPVKEGMKVELTCGGTTVAGATDKNGAYRLFAENEGKCTLVLVVGDQRPATTVRSFPDESARYNLVLQRKDGACSLASE